MPILTDTVEKFTQWTPTIELRRKLRELVADFPRQLFAEYSGARWFFTKPEGHPLLGVVLCAFLERAILRGSGPQEAEQEKLIKAVFPDSESLRSCMERIINSHVSRNRVLSRSSQSEGEEHMDPTFRAECAAYFDKKLRTRFPESVRSPGPDKASSLGNCAGPLMKHSEGLIDSEMRLLPYLAETLGCTIELHLVHNTRMDSFDYVPYNPLKCQGEIKVSVVWLWRNVVFSLYTEEERRFHQAFIPPVTPPNEEEKKAPVDLAETRRRKTDLAGTLGTRLPKTSLLSRLSKGEERDKRVMEDAEQIEDDIMRCEGYFDDKDVKDAAVKLRNELDKIITK